MYQLRAKEQQKSVLCEELLKGVYPMKFRLKKAEDGIVLEMFLKAVKAEEDYQKIRFMIKDGHVTVNGEPEYARRRLLLVGDEVTFKDKYYLITSYKDEIMGEAEEEFAEIERSEKQNSIPVSQEKIIHHKKPLQWSRKYVKKTTS